LALFLKRRRRNVGLTRHADSLMRFVGYWKTAGGFVLLQNGRAPRRVTNVRDDMILGSRFWRGSFEERRCLVPATSFCEPNGDVKPASWHWFGLRGSDERPLFAFPGIWRGLPRAGEKRPPED
jgi:putative SOS response-associated peptidase YedK